VVNGGNDRQIWYKVSPIDFTNQANGWIVVRYDGKDFITQSDACSSAPAPAALTFPYDRRAAANYAIEHSYDRDMNPTSLQSGYIVRQLPNVPFGSMFYSYLSASPGSTGSTMFVSEGVWTGGLPMTLGIANSCDPFPTGSPGWRYCRDLSGSSDPWDFHQAFVAYYTNIDVPGVPFIDYSPSILSNANLGTQLTFAGCGTVQLDRISSGNSPNDGPNQDIDMYFTQSSDPSIDGNRGGALSNPSGLSGRLVELITCSGENIRQGDYIYINPQSISNPNPEAIEDAHGLLVVGWGPAVDCSVAFTTRSTIGNFSEVQTVVNAIPYIADFTTAQPQRARPFYCTMAYDDSATGTYFFRHDWFFFRMPDQITVSIAELYVNPNWNW
jgi:hypothetical protein